MRPGPAIATPPHPAVGRILRGMTAPLPLVLHPARTRLTLMMAGPVLLVLLGGLSLVDGGTSTGALVVLCLGLVLGVVVLLDVPLRVEFDADGVTRVCAGRQDRLSWSELTAVTRTAGRPGLGEIIGRSRDDGHRGRPAGLVLRRGARRNILLVDRCESHAEWTVLRDLLADRATAFAAPEPPTGHPPAGRGPAALHARMATGA